MFYNIINNNKILFLYIKKHTSVVLINDLYVFKEKNGNIYPVHFINYFQIQIILNWHKYNKQYMKDLVKRILERGSGDETVTMPEWCDIVKISPNDFDGSVSFLKIADIKEDKSLEKVLKLGPWESIVIDEDIYVMIIDPEALNEK